MGKQTSPETKGDEMTTQESTEKLAKEMVEFYREEFPGEGPDWDSDWWTACKNWDEDEFSEFLTECKRIW